MRDFSSLEMYAGEITPAPVRRVQPVHQPESEVELKAQRHCVHRARPYRSESRTRRITARLDLAYTFRPRGRPRKEA